MKPLPLPSPVRFDRQRVMTMAWQRAREIAARRGMSPADLLPDQLRYAWEVEKRRVENRLGMEVRTYLLVLDVRCITRRAKERTPALMAPLLAA